MTLDAFPFFSDIASYWPQIVRGLRDTILLSVTITVTGLIGGIAVFGLSLSPNRIVRYVTQSYVSLFIGTPLIVFLFLLYYGLPNLGVKLSPFVIAVLGFTLNVSAYNARYLTIAYKGLDQAELESARAQGFSLFQVFFLITAPGAPNVGSFADQPGHPERQGQLDRLPHPVHRILRADAGSRLAHLPVLQDLRVHRARLSVTGVGGRPRGPPDRAQAGDSGDELTDRDVAPALSGGAFRKQP